MCARDAYTQCCCDETDRGCFEAPLCARAPIELENVKDPSLGSLSIQCHDFPMLWGSVTHICYIYTKRPPEKGVVRDVGVLGYQV